MRFSAGNSFVENEEELRKQVQGPLKNILDKMEKGQMTPDNEYRKKIQKAYDEIEKIIDSWYKDPIKTSRKLQTDHDYRNSFSIKVEKILNDNVRPVIEKIATTDNSKSINARNMGEEQRKDLAKVGNDLLKKYTNGPSTAKKSGIGSLFEKVKTHVKETKQKIGRKFESKKSSGLAQAWDREFNKEDPNTKVSKGYSSKYLNDLGKKIEKEKNSRNEPEEPTTPVAGPQTPRQK